MNNVTSAVALPQSTSVLRDYYELTKPGITQMVAMTTVTGYYMAIPTDVIAYASNSHHWMHFIAATLGAVFISSGSCVYNHVLEQRSDALMKRTASRPLPSGTISTVSALVYGTLLSLIGVLLLSATNSATVVLAIATWLSYVVLYTPLKSRTSFAMLIGGIPGALPFAGGWVAVSGTLDLEAMVLFAILFFWQMPHFLALGWMYRTDYLSGGLALRALQDETGVRASVQMIVYSALLLGVVGLPTIVGVTSVPYLIGSCAVCIWLLAETIRFSKVRDIPSARRVLLTSYAVLMGILLLMVIDKVTP